MLMRRNGERGGRRKKKRLEIKCRLEVDDLVEQSWKERDRKGIDKNLSTPESKRSHGLIQPNKFP